VAVAAWVGAITGGSGVLAAAAGMHRPEFRLSHICFRAQSSGKPLTSGSILSGTASAQAIHSDCTAVFTEQLRTCNEK
jgi:hypothetical protein